MARLLIALIAIAVSASAFASSPAESEKQRQWAEITELVSKKDYRAILNAAEEQAATQARFADGLWRQTLLYHGFSAALQAQMVKDLDWDEAEAATALLAKTNAMAWLLHEQVLSARAWKTRGSGYASQVSAEAFRQFHQSLSRGRQILDEHKAALAGNPSWYAMRITIALELGEGESAVKALFDEGHGRHAGHHDIYFSRMRQLSPNWGGSKVRMLDFLDEVRKMGGKTLEEGMYARLVWYAEGLGYSLTHEPRLDRDAMRESSNQVLARFPDQWNAQKLFFLACERSDKEQALNTMKLVRDPLLPQIWKSNPPLYQTCKDWASGRIPVFILRTHDGTGVQEYLIQ